MSKIILISVFLTVLPFCEENFTEFCNMKPIITRNITKYIRSMRLAQYSTKKKRKKTVTILVALFIVLQFHIKIKKVPFFFYQKIKKMC